MLKDWKTTTAAVALAVTMALGQTEAISEQKATAFTQIIAAVGLLFAKDTKKQQ